MATGDYYSLPLAFKVPKRRRTECSHPLPLSDSGLTEDEKDCILALLALSRAPLIHDEEKTPAEEERPPLSPPEVERQSLWLPSPSSSSPPKQQQELSPISLPSHSQQDQPPPLQPQQNQPLPSPSSSSPPKKQQELSPISLPSHSQQDQPQQNQPLPPPPPPPPAERDYLPPLPLPLPLPVQAPSLVLCPVPIRCYRPPLPPPSPFVSLAPTQQNQARYECPECGKAFSSYQALGGHKTSHRKRPAENSAAASAAVVTTRATDQNKPHTCSLCHKSFPTGQALGGHMRAHYQGTKQQATTESRPVAAQSSSLTDCSTAVGLGIDLNRPATPEAGWATEEEAVSSQAAAAVATSRPPRFLTFF